MASIDDLKNVLKETLDNRGALNQIRARIRAEVFSALDDQTDMKPVLSNENMLINELIREYLEFNKYKYSSTVLTAESGQPKDPIDREFLSSELGIRESRKSKQLPILYGLVSHFLDGRHKENKDGRWSPANSQLSSISGRRSPTASGRRSPTSGRQSPTASGRRSPTASGRQSPTVSGRRSPTASGRRSPPSPSYTSKDLRRSPTSSRRSPTNHSTSGQNKTSQRHKSSPPTTDKFPLIRKHHYDGDRDADSSLKGLVYHSTGKWY